MANEEHLTILKQGVEVWNRWREENPDMRPDLSESNLTGMELTEIDFRETILDQTDLAMTNLTEADFVKAYLTRANLIDADLSRTYFTEADLRWADLRRTKLTGALLIGSTLAGANLTEADLTGADLTGARIAWSTLAGANLTEVDLTEANFTRANLNGAIFRRANLRSTDLSNANISGTDLSGADLHGANLNNAILRNTDLSGATVAWTSFGNVDLSEVKGLDSVDHRGPSVIGIDSIYRSKGKVPEIFLRGAGVPDSMIQFMHSLVHSERPIDFYSCFISYSSKDRDFAKRLHNDLQSEGVRCWFAPEDMKIGDRIRQRIDESIRIHDKLLLVLSDNSIDSQWVEKEVETAWEEERRRGETVLFPVMLDDSVFETNQAWAADIRRQRHIGDFHSWKDHDSYQKAFSRLLRDLKAES